jgi:hypothetical protein
MEEIACVVHTSWCQAAGTIRISGLDFRTGQVLRFNLKGRHEKRLLGSCI